LIRAGDPISTKDKTTLTPLLNEKTTTLDYIIKRVLCSEAKVNYPRILYQSNPIRLPTTKRPDAGDIRTYFPDKHRRHHYFSVPIIIPMNGVISPPLPLPGARYVAVCVFVTSCNSGVITVGDRKPACLFSILVSVLRPYLLFYSLFCGSPMRASYPPPLPPPFPTPSLLHVHSVH
jgi:hypothetical protein